MRVANFLRILAVAFALAGYSAWSRGVRDARQPAAGPTAVVDQIPLLRRDEAEALWQQPGTLFIDVRTAADYEFGHVAGAVSIPEEEIETRLPALKDRLGRAAVLVVYCRSIDCGKSLWAALRLREAGLTRARIYPEGWNEWVTSGLPTATGKG